MTLTKKKHWTVLKREREAQEHADRDKVRAIKIDVLEKEIKRHGFQETKGTDDGYGWLIGRASKTIGGSIFTVSVTISADHDGDGFSVNCRGSVHPGPESYYRGGWSGSLDVTHVKTVKEAMDWAVIKLSN